MSNYDSWSAVAKDCMTSSWYWKGVALVVLPLIAVQVLIYLATS